MVGRDVTINKGGGSAAGRVIEADAHGILLHWSNNGEYMYHPWSSINSVHLEGWTDADSEPSSTVHY